MNYRLILFLLVFGIGGSLRAEPAPIRLAVVGLVHGHTSRFIKTALERSDVNLVGVVEEDENLLRRYSVTYKLKPEVTFSSLEAMLENVKPQAVAIFTTTFDHTRVVEECAKRGIHAMMEKPFAVNMEHARKMAADAERGKIELVVNFITTWYASNQLACQLAREPKTIGELRKILVRDGHGGRKPPEEFFAWLNDPKQNGGGVIADFGCYGANLVSWLMRGERPTSVFAVAQHFRPEVWTQVEDDATIVVTYAKAQAVLQPSWNWPFRRKDIEIYGERGYLLAPEEDKLMLRRIDENEVAVPLPQLPSANDQAISYLAAIVRGEARSEGLSSVAVNLLATEILDAAKESVQTGRRVELR